MNLHVIEFIKNNKNWIELLENKPYCLKIKCENKYYMLSYNQIESDFSNDIVKECRGLIIDIEKFTPVCYPFTKFFNIDESNASKIDWKSAKVQEKIDGSIIKLWATEQEGSIQWKVSTNNCIEAIKCDLPNSNDKYKTFYDLFADLFSFEKYVSKLNPNYTYIFEMVSRYNKVVIDYPQPKIYHIGTRDNISGKELNIDIGIEKPKEYNLKTEEEVRFAANKLSYNEEGYVVVDKNWHRVKIKSPAWIKAHMLVNNRIVTQERILDIIRINEQEEFLTYFPEYAIYFKDLEEWYFSYHFKMINLINFVKSGLLERVWENRKDFAKWAFTNHKNDSDICFKIYDNMIENEYDFKVYIAGLDSKKIIERKNKDD